MSWVWDVLDGWALFAVAFMIFLSGYVFGYGHTRRETRRSRR